MEQHIPGGKVPQHPRSILGSAILPFFLSVRLSPAEIAVERLIHEIEVEAARPSWHRALAGALVALAGAS